MGSDPPVPLLFSVLVSQDFAQDLVCLEGDRVPQVPETQLLSKGTKFQMNEPNRDIKLKGQIEEAPRGSSG